MNKRKAREVLGNSMIMMGWFVRLFRLKPTKVNPGLMNSGTDVKGDVGSQAELDMSKKPSSKIDLTPNPPDMDSRPRAGPSPIGFRGNISIRDSNPLFKNDSVKGDAYQPSPSPLRGSSSPH